MCSSGAEEVYGSDPGFSLELDFSEAAKKQAVVKLQHDTLPIQDWGIGRMICTDGGPAFKIQRSINAQDYSITYDQFFQTKTGSGIVSDVLTC